MKRIAGSALVLWTWLWTTMAASAQTPVGVLAIDERQGRPSRVRRRCLSAARAARWFSRSSDARPTRPIRTPTARRWAEGRVPSCCRYLAKGMPNASRTRFAARGSAGCPLSLEPCRLPSRDYFLLPLPRTTRTRHPTRRRHERTCQARRHCRRRLSRLDDRRVFVKSLATDRHNHRSRVAHGIHHRRRRGDDTQLAARLL